MRRLAWIVVAVALASCERSVVDGTVVPVPTRDLGPCPIPGATNPNDPDAVTPHPDNDPGCPATPDKGSCASPTLCAYDVPCQSGITVITFHCETGNPSVDPEAHGGHPCRLLYDSCESIDAICDRPGDQRFGPATGSDDPIPCPWDRPAEGSDCKGNYYGGPRCGFWCDDSHEAWTVAECIAPGSLMPGYWLYDDACRPECAAE